LNYQKTIFVVNPHAGNGVTGREWPRISKRAGELSALSKPVSRGTDQTPPE